jgi:hypothetical protein
MDTVWGMIGQYLRPGTGRQPDDQNTRRLSVERANGKCTNDQILVVGGINIEESVVDAAAVDSVIRQHRDDRTGVMAIAKS